MNDSETGPSAARDTDIYPQGGKRSRTLSRRVVLAGSVATGVTATAGCLGDDQDDGDEVVEEPTVYVSNTGDGSVTIIDAASQSVVETRALGLSTSFPSNQHSPQLTTEPGDPLWLNVGEGVRALAAGSLTELTRLDTGSGANWLEQTPDGAHLLVSAREPAHVQYRLDADPSSAQFGEVTGQIDRTSEDGRGDNEGPGPCDVTIHPDGEYAYVPDLFGDSVTVIDVAGFEIATQVAVEGVGDAPPEPWMGTAGWDGTHLLIEHNEGPTGGESLWDISDPSAPVERRRLTPEDGLGEGPLTSEIGPDAAFGYVFTPDTDDVTVIDLEAATVTSRLDLGGSAFTGGWDPAREYLYVPVQSSNEVAVIDAESREITTRLETGSEPYGVTAATIRPAAGAGEGNSLLTQLSALTGSYETTYCLSECACGHEL